MSGLERATVLIDLRRYSEAETALRTLLANEPENVQATRMLAETVGNLDRHDEQEQLARRAISLDPEDQQGYRVLADALISLGGRDDVVAVARRGVELAPWSWSTHYTLGRAYRSAPAPDRASALAAAQEALRLAPHNADAYNLLGICLSEIGRTSEAEAAYHEALRLDPHHGLALNNLALLSVKRGELRGASRLLTSALGTDPGLKIVQQNLDVVLLKLIRRLCLILVVGVGLEWAAAQGTTSVPVVRGVLCAVTVLACAGVITRVLRELPRGSLRWALKVGNRVGAEFALLIFGFPALLGILCWLAVADQHTAQETANAAGPAFLRLLVISTVAGAIRSRSRKKR